eukprot:2028178-Pyramimonas_sp.AAC.1
MQCRRPRPLGILAWGPGPPGEPPGTFEFAECLEHNPQWSTPGGETRSVNGWTPDKESRRARGSGGCIECRGCSKAP